MENATKALIIAAAVLIAILLITLGVNIFNTASEQASSADLTEYQIMQFNEKFLRYEGKKVSAREVNELVKTAFYHNTTYSDDTSMRVRVCYNGGGNWSSNADNADGGKFLVLRESFNQTTSIRTVPAGNVYFVKAKMDSRTGLIFQIDVETPDYASERCTESSHHH